MTTDLLNITWDNGKYSLIQDATGKTSARRHGEPWPAGDELVFGCNYILSLGQALEAARERIAELEEELRLASRREVWADTGIMPMPVYED